MKEGFSFWKWLSQFLGINFLLKAKTLSYEAIQKTLKTELTELKNAEKEKRLAEKKEQNEEHLFR